MTLIQPLASMAIVTLTIGMTLGLGSISPQIDEWLKSVRAGRDE
jgi:hypothetical protein